MKRVVRERSTQVGMKNRGRKKREKERIGEGYNKRETEGWEEKRKRER